MNGRTEMKGWMGKVLALILAMAMMLSLAACGGGSSSASEAPSAENTKEGISDEIKEGTTQKDIDTSRPSTENTDKNYESLTIAVSSDVTNWDPNAQIDVSGTLMRDLVYQCLFIVVEDDYYPLVAKGYTVVDDRHWDVEIHDNVYDSEGNHLTADDVVFCYETRIAAGTAAKYDAFAGIEKVSDYTVRFTWTDSVESINSLGLIWGETYLYTRAAYESHSFAVEPIGTGPYVVADLTSGAQVVLERRDDYWKTEDLTWYEQTNVDQLIYDVLPETSQNYVGLQTGTIGYSANVPAENIGDFEDGGSYDNDYNVYKKLGTFSYILTCNQSGARIGSDENFRRAVYYALDNNAIAEAAGSFVGAETFSNPGGTDFVEEWTKDQTYINTVNTDLAKEYLEQSGYNGEKLVLLGESTEAVKNMMVMMQALLLNIGINCEIEAMDYTSVVSTSTDKNAWDLAVFYYGGSINISGMNRILNTAEWGTGAGFGFVNDATLTDLFMAARTKEGHTDENMKALVDYIIEKGYFTMLCFPVNSIVYSADIANLYVDPSGALCLNASTFYLD